MRVSVRVLMEINHQVMILSAHLPTSAIMTGPYFSIKCCARGLVQYVGPLELATAAAFIFGCSGFEFYSCFICSRAIRASHASVCHASDHRVIFIWLNMYA